MKNRKTLSIIGIALTVAIILTSCATVKPAGEDQILDIIALINEGDSESLTARSTDSFLFDSEILHNPKLIKNLWEGLAESGFRIADPVIETGRLLLPLDQNYFGTGAEIDAFFNKYIPEQSSLFKVRTPSGNYFFVLGPDDVGISTIAAFGGPY